MDKIYQHPFSKILMVSVFLLTLFFGSVSTVEAAGSDDDGVIEEGETIYDDVFLEGDDVRVDGTVEGNLIAFANTITINGSIAGDAFLFGNTVEIGENAVIEGNLISGAQTVYVQGTIERSLAVGSGAMVLKPGAKISRNVYFGGFSLEAEEGSSVLIDLFAGIYQMQLNGSVGRDVNAGAGAVVINGSVNGDVRLDMGEINTSSVYFPTPPGVTEALPPGLRIDENAFIGGDLKYTISVDQSDHILTQPEGQVIFHTPVPVDQPEIRIDRTPERDGFGWALGSFISRTLRKFWLNLFSLLLIGAVVVQLLPGFFNRSVNEIRRQPLSSAGFGILTVVLGYIGLTLAIFVILTIGILLTVISAGGLRTATFGFGFASLGLIGTTFTMLVIYGSKIIVAYLVGNWILVKLAPESKAAEKPFWGMALGVLIYAILRSIPFLGGLVAFLAIIFGMGAFWLAYRNRKEVYPETAQVEDNKEALEA